MKKIYLLVIISVLCFCLCACTKADVSPGVGETQEKSQTNESSKAVLETVRDEILKELSIKDAMFIETENLNSLYGIKESAVSSSACFVTMSGTFPHEIIMVEVTDEGEIEEIVAVLNKKLSEVLVQSKSYDPKNYELAQQCKVFTKGNYVTLFLSPDHANMQTILEKYI